MRNKLKTTSFWLGLSAALVIILDTITELLGIKLYSNEVESVILSICSILVTIGIVTKRKVTDEKEVDKKELLEDIEESMKK